MAQPDGVIVHGDVAISEIATKRFKITITSPYADKSASGTPSFIKKETVLRTGRGPVPRSLGEVGWRGYSQSTDYKVQTSNDVCAGGAPHSPPWGGAPFRRNGIQGGVILLPARQ